MKKKVVFGSSSRKFTYGKQGKKVPKEKTFLKYVYIVQYILAYTVLCIALPCVRRCNQK